MKDLFAIVTKTTFRFRFGPEPEQSEKSKHDREEDLFFPSSSLSDATGDHETAKQGSKNMSSSKEEILTRLVAPAVHIQASCNL